MNNATNLTSHCTQSYYVKGARIFMVEVFQIYHNYKCINGIVDGHWATLLHAIITGRLTVWKKRTNTDLDHIECNFSFWKLTRWCIMIFDFYRRSSIFIRNTHFISFGKMVTMVVQFFRYLFHSISYICFTERMKNAQCIAG